MSRQRPLRFRQGFSIADLNSSIAEDDPHLAHYYYARDRYVDRALNREDNASVFTGPKGVGKSAILGMVRAHAQATGNQNRVIEIAPDDLAFNALSNIETKTPLLSTAAQRQWLFTSLWDYVLCAELLVREKKDANALARFIQSLVKSRDRTQRDNLLKITLDDSGQQISLTDKMLRLVRALELEGGYEGTTITARAETSNITSKSNDLQLLQLISTVAKKLPSSLEHDYFVLIDDLDFYWQGTDVQKAFLAAMFLTIRKMSRERRIKFVVSLRKNIYREIELEEHDKFTPFVCDVSWSKSDIQHMAEKRISFILQVNETKVWGDLFPEHTFEYIWNNTGGMPREILRLTSTSIEIALSNHDASVSLETINTATTNFSETRRGELASQYRFKYPNLALVLKQFSGQKKEFNIELLQEIGMNIQDIVEKNSELTNLVWATAGFDDPLALGRALLDIEFLLIKDGRSAQARKASEEEIQLLDASKWFAVNPMYHAGLGLDGYNTLS